MEQQEPTAPSRNYNPHYLKSRDQILANAKAHQKRKQQMLREEKKRKIALEYLQQQLLQTKN